MKYKILKTNSGKFILKYKIKFIWRAASVLCGGAGEVWSEQKQFDTKREAKDYALRIYKLHAEDRKSKEEAKSFNKNTIAEEITDKELVKWLLKNNK